MAVVLGVVPLAFLANFNPTRFVFWIYFFK